MSSRASAITPAGIVLSQPTSTMIASNRLPRATSSIESVMTSRLTSEARIPSDPIVMPSEIETVLNSSGVPPAWRMPSLTCAASSRRWKLQGPISIQVLATPISGRVKSSSVRPDARSIARAGARLSPSVRAPLRHFNGCVDIGSGVSTSGRHHGCGPSDGIVPQAQEDKGNQLILEYHKRRLSSGPIADRAIRGYNPAVPPR